MKAKPTKLSKPDKKTAKQKPSPGAAKPAKPIDIRAEMNRQLAAAKEKRSGRRGAPANGAKASAPTGERRGVGRPKTTPAAERQAPRRSPARAARDVALAGVKGLAGLMALPFPALSVAETAAILGCSNMHVSNCLATGQLVAINIGRPGGVRACNRILKASLETFIAKRGGGEIPAEEE